MRMISNNAYFTHNWQMIAVDAWICGSVFREHLAMGRATVDGVGMAGFAPKRCLLLF